ncbi:uncharacterized protein WM294_016501 [Sarcoramphus papa]
MCQCLRRLKDSYRPSYDFYLLLAQDGRGSSRKLLGTNTPELAASQYSDGFRQTGANHIICRRSRRSTPAKLTLVLPLAQPVGPKGSGLPGWGSAAEGLESGIKIHIAWQVFS